MGRLLVFLRLVLYYAVKKPFWRLFSLSDSSGFSNLLSPYTESPGWAVAWGCRGAPPLPRALHAQEMIRLMACLRGEMRSRSWPTPHGTMEAGSLVALGLEADLGW